MTLSLLEQAKRLPQSPGVYIFRNPKGKALYVGKAKRLRSRVMQYINGHDGRSMVGRLVQSSATIDVTLTFSEREALLVESGLIHKYRPHFNVRLLEGTRYLHIGIDKSHKWPRFFLARSPKQRKNTTYFGPLPSAKAARETLTFLNRSFGYRTCSDRELQQAKRPCLEFQMHRCLAPCVERCLPDEYNEVVQSACEFLSGKQHSLLRRLKIRMNTLSESERFEEAAKSRDLIRHIKETISSQNVANPNSSDLDAWGWSREGGEGFVCILPFRNGLLQEAIILSFKDVIGEDDREILSSMINTWYSPEASIPNEILLPIMPQSHDAMAQLLSEWKGKKCRLRVPKRGSKHKLLDLSITNAKSAHERAASDTQRRQKNLLRLKEICNLPRLPLRIECYDNSNIQGTDPVSSMVTFREGKPDKSLYRRFMIKTVVGSDDYASMREVLRRRLVRALDPKDSAKGWAPPDLIIVDGGKGQLSAALQVLSELGIDTIPVIGLAKPRTEHAKGDLNATDKIILPGQSDAIRLDAHDPVLRMLQYIRNEAHDAAVGFHRKRRQKTRLRSQLDVLPGVGPKRRKALLRHFRSVEGVLNASQEELASVEGIGSVLAAQMIYAIHGEESKPKS
jgi:excinuclease ABC subunit C